MTGEEIDPQAALLAWLRAYDPADRDPALLTERFVAHVAAGGIELIRCSIWLPTAHPELWGTQVIWELGVGARVFERPYTVAETGTYVGTPGEVIHRLRRPLRYRLDVDDEALTLPMLRDLKAAGATDYFMAPFQTHHEYWQPWIAFTTASPGGFSDPQLARLEEYCVLLGWKARVALAEHATRSLLEVYLGRNAARRVMAGHFRRGTGESMRAVIWFCDLRGFTALGDRLPARELVGVLDQYFECAAGPIEDEGGEILKFIGDAILAVFEVDETNRACSAALRAAARAIENLRVWSALEDHPRLEMGVALHVGDVLYGNVGGRSRLDFTVIGAAVNEASRVEGLCKTVGTPLLVTEELARLCGAGPLVSVGTHALRGVETPKELFTLRQFYSR